VSRGTDVPVRIFLFPFSTLAEFVIPDAYQKRIPFQSFKTFNHCVPFKTFQANVGSKSSKVPVVPMANKMPWPVPNVPGVPLVEDVPEVIILPELWQKTSGVVTDFPHHLCSEACGGSVRVNGARKAAGRRIRKGNDA
jgi:hypothetical protein